MKALNSHWYLLNPITQLDLDHRAYFLSGADYSGSRLTAASKEGNISSCDLDTGVVKPLPTAPREIRAFASHPFERILALIDEATGDLHIRDFDGSVIFEEKAPDKRGERQAWTTYGFSACFFDNRGVFLWCAVGISRDKIEIQRRETKSWRIVSRMVVDDPFGSSEPFFHSAGQSDTLVLWLAAGQDGQQIYWIVMRPDGFECKPVMDLRDVIPPAFSKDGSEFLVFDQAGTLQRYSYWPYRLLAHCESPCGDEDYFDGSMCYLDVKKALVATLHSRLFLIDLERLSVISENAVKGHEPKPTELYYPTLRGDCALCSDLSYFQRFANRIAAIYRRDRGRELKKWQDNILSFRVEDFDASSYRH